MNYGDFRSVLLTNRQCIFERKTDSERVLVAINADDQPFMAHFDAGCGTAVDLITGETHDFGGGSELAPLQCGLLENGTLECDFADSVALL